MLVGKKVSYKKKVIARMTIRQSRSIVSVLSFATCSLASFTKLCDVNLFSLYYSMYTPRHVYIIYLCTSIVSCLYFSNLCFNMCNEHTLLKVFVFLFFNLKNKRRESKYDEYKHKLRKETKCQILSRHKNLFSVILSINSLINYPCTMTNASFALEKCREVNAFLLLLINGVINVSIFWYIYIYTLELNAIEKIKRRIRERENLRKNHLILIAIELLLHVTSITCALDDRTLFDWIRLRK